jgi:hypothetical protein
MKSDDKKAGADAIASKDGLGISDVTKMCLRDLAELKTPEASQELGRRVMEERDKIIRLNIGELTALLLARSIRPDETDIRLRAVRDEILTRLDA